MDSCTMYTREVKLSNGYQRCIIGDTAVNVAYIQHERTWEGEFSFSRLILRRISIGNKTTLW